MRPCVLQRLSILLLLLGALSTPVLCQQSTGASASGAHIVIWSAPGDIAAKDLFHGPGGEKHQPHMPVKFLKEDKSGHNSKLDVEDSGGEKWKAKPGIEAQPETVATRLLWAVGYFTNENYFVPDLEVTGLPAHLHRGQGHVTSPNHLEKVRLQRLPSGKKKDGNWDWRHNPFVGKREFNGLRVMMALISNWDLKNENNGIYKEKDSRNDEEDYLVTDLGTAFGASGDRWTEAGSKNNLKAYRSAKFITKITAEHVNFSFPRFPPFLYIFDLPHYAHQVSLRFIGNKVPRADAKWIGSLLAQLSNRQIEDAFRAGGYPPDQAAAFSKVVEARIAELNRL